MQTVAGIQYKKPKVSLLHATPLVNAELAGRTCYQSFGKSEHLQVREFKGIPIDDIESSELMESLCHVYHHNSVSEHINLTYNVTTSRGVLQEQSRHRIQSLSVQSTRYTMSSVLNAYNATVTFHDFFWIIKQLDMFVVDGYALELEVKHLYEKLELQSNIATLSKWFGMTCSNEQEHYLHYQNDKDEVIFSTLQSMKQKRNVGDIFKWIVTDNWKVDLVFTMNLRALTNYLKLRDSGAAYFQMQWLADAVVKATPQKYLNLVSKKYAH